MAKVFVYIRGPDWISGELVCGGEMCVCVCASTVAETKRPSRNKP